MTARSRAVDLLVRTVAPLVLALVAAGLVMLALGADPLAFYADVLRLGLAGDGWQRTLTAMAPLLLVAFGLIVAFRARLWNLGSGGVYLLAATVVVGVAPAAMRALPYGLAVAALCGIAFLVGAAAMLLPALLRAGRGVTEVVTTLMVSFIAMHASNLLIRGAFQDPGTALPQTRVLDLAGMLPYVPGTRVHVGVVIALAVVLAGHVVLTRTSLGLRIDALGESPAAAAHAGVRVPGLVVGVLLVSGGMVALAGAVDMLGLWGYTRADWNPGYGDRILPFVFLARLNPAGSIPLVGLYAILATGGTIAAQRAGLSVDVLLLIVALVLGFMVLIEALGRRFDLGTGYLRAGARAADAVAERAAGAAR